MHEMSLIRSLLRQVEQVMVQHDATSVDVVTVEIGPLSGVEAELVQNAFSQLVSTATLGSPRLEIREIELQIRCRACEHLSSVAGMALQCPHCGSPLVQVIRGDEFRIIDVSMQVPETLKGDEQ